MATRAFMVYMDLGTARPKPGVKQLCTACPANSHPMLADLASLLPCRCHQRKCWGAGHHPGQHGHWLLHSQGQGQQQELELLFPRCWQAHVPHQSLLQHHTGGFRAVHGWHCVRHQPARPRRGPCSLQGPFQSHGQSSRLPTKRSSLTGRQMQQMISQDYSAVIGRETSGSCPLFGLPTI